MALITSGFDTICYLTIKWPWSPHVAGLYSRAMALIASDCDAICSMSIKWP